MNEITLTGAHVRLEPLQVPFAIVRASDEAIVGSTRFFDIERWPWPRDHVRARTASRSMAVRSASRGLQAMRSARRSTPRRKR